jgi:hypothetical protein
MLMRFDALPSSVSGYSWYVYTYGYMDVSCDVDEV